MMQGGFDIEKLREHAHYRWLKPSEVFYILQKHEEFGIAQVTPKEPPSGSLLLFNRRVHRFFRKDGYAWQKKKDGRSVGEAHEHLKVGNSNALNCYYARGEQNPYFQRRCYWMLNPEFEHIVLVHYREVSEGRYTYTPDMSPDTDFVEEDGSSNFNGKNRQCYIDSDEKFGISSGTLDGISSTANESTVHLKSVEKVNDFDISEFLSPSREGPQDSGDIVNQPFQLLASNSSTELQQFWEISPALGFCRNDLNAHERKLDTLLGNHPEFINAAENGIDILVSPSENECRYQNPYIAPKNLNTFQLSTRGDNIESESINFQHVGKIIDISEDGEFVFEPNEYTKMPIAAVNNEVAASNISFKLHDKDTGTALKDVVSSFDSSGTHAFMIREISPEQAYSSKNTKVIIIGDFPIIPLDHPLVAMFDDTEVPLQIVQNGVLCCQAPEHVPGKVKLCITSGNRKSCSNVRDFEYLSDTQSTSKKDLSKANVTSSSGELELLIRLAKILLCGYDSGQLQRNPESRTSPSGKLVEHDHWEKNIEAILSANETVSDSMKWVLQELVKDKLQHWLSSKLQEGEQTCSSLSKDEQCVIHMISGLGFEWALSSLLDIKVGINFRDCYGWTALHWAAHFGREEMVAALLAAGALAGAVTDPTSGDPIGKTPASIAASSGHKGLAGYLSEVALTSHLSSLTIGETEKSQECAASEAARTVEIAFGRSKQISTDATEDQFLLADSLAAVRNAAWAAARILSAFRSLSFKMRQQEAVVTRDEYGLTLEEYRHLSAVQRQQKAFPDAKDQKFYEAALCIQTKFRGWKGRRNFVALRHNVVKIQAHVRGYQVRKKYKEMLGCVNIIEKIMLRWRRGRAGLRGFRLESSQMEEVEEDDILKVFRKQKVDAALDKDFKRVLSMVGSKEARQQYSRMIHRHPQYKEEQAGEYTSSSEQNDDIDYETLQDLMWPPPSPLLHEWTMPYEYRTHSGELLVDELWPSS